MVLDAVRAYAQLASGLTEVTRERAMTTAKALVAQLGALSEAPAQSTAQARVLAEELTKAARANRDAMLSMIRTETERAVAAVGVATGEDLGTMQRRLAALEERLADVMRTATQMGEASFTAAQAAGASLAHTVSRDGSAKTAEFSAEKPKSGEGAAI